jgi:hypothetical protein
MGQMTDAKKKVSQKTWKEETIWENLDVDGRVILKYKLQI